MLVSSTLGTDALLTGNLVRSVATSNKSVSGRLAPTIGGGKGGSGVVCVRGRPEAADNGAFMLEEAKGV